uniref:Uncharacterized protein n=1 Tax=Panagrolaimus sp. ES5 TaxID=591445 RepID=A0AC34GW87_9BILA
MKKKSEAALALSIIGPTLSGAGLAVGLINYFRTNPVIPELQRLREDIFARLDKIDQEISSNLGAKTIQSDFFS